MSPRHPISVVAKAAYTSLVAALTLALATAVPTRPAAATETDSHAEATPAPLPASADEPGADGDREAGPDPAAALSQAARKGGHAASTPYPPTELDWGIAASPENAEVDVEALPDSPMATLDPAFPVPGQLRTRVDFWKFIYSQAGLYDIMVHDTRHMDVIYEVVQMPSRPVEWKSYLKARKATVRRAREKYRAILARLAAATPGSRLSAEEERVQALLASLPGGPEKYREAGRRIHGQAGMRDRFLEALEASERYLPEMERIFRERNLPIELTRLPFVESGFNPQASSKSRAVGVWQFIKSTARLYDLVDKKQDRRRDVTASTIAAAKLLSYNHRQIGSWPLALMAYHHGLAGIKTAVRRTGTTDVDVIVRTYNGRRFKYASRNYYAQFVAVNELYNLVEHGERHSRPAEEVLSDIDRPGATGPAEAELTEGPSAAN
jgi:soluble lytic murein transglycosylase-like protein